MSNRNITLTLPAELIRQAKVVAALRDTSVSALVAELLRSVTEKDDDYTQQWHKEMQLMKKGLPMRVGRVTWSRSDSHER